jgi:hypothetical protein
VAFSRGPEVPTSLCFFSPLIDVPAACIFVALVHCFMSHIWQELIGIAYK